MLSSTSVFRSAYTDRTRSTKMILMTRRTPRILLDSSRSSLFRYAFSFMDFPPLILQTLFFVKIKVILSVFLFLNFLAQKIPGHHNDQKQNNWNKELEKDHKGWVALQAQLRRAEKCFINSVKRLAQPVEKLIVKHDIHHNDDAVNHPAHAVFDGISHSAHLLSSILLIFQTIFS